MFKAMALICSAWIANGEAKQSCFTHMFKWEFETKKECQEMRLIYFKEVPPYHNIVLGECIEVNKTKIVNMIDKVDQIKKAREEVIVSS